MYEIKYRLEDEMKDSGIEWLSKVPEEWIVCKIKNISYLKTGNSISATDKDNKYSKLILQYYSYIGTKDIDLDTNNIEYDNGLYIPKTTEFKTARKHTSLICIEGGSAGCKLGYLDRKVCFGNKLCNVEGNNKIINKLLYYILQSNYFKEDFFNRTTGIIPGVSIEEFKNIISVVPVLNEQQKIANFLDIKTTEFDSIISKKELLIEKLEEAKKSLISEVVTGKVKIVNGELVERKPDEMKDSGIEWLGMIPKDWKVTKIKYLSEIISKGTTPSTVGREISLEGKIRYLKAENIVNNRISKFPEFYINDRTNQILSRSKLKEDDIVFVIAGATIGKVAILNKEYLPANTNQAISFIRLLNKSNTKFIHYWLSSILIQNYMWTLTVQSAQPNLSMESLGNFYVPWPDENLLDDIVGYLDNLCSEIDSIITKTKLQIQKLKEAKQSLISEAVTGKIDLRDWEIEEI